MDLTQRGKQSLEQFSVRHAGSFPQGDHPASLVERSCNKDALPQVVHFKLPAKGATAILRSTVGMKGCPVGHPSAFAIQVMSDRTPDCGPREGRCAQALR